MKLDLKQIDFAQLKKRWHSRSVLAVTLKSDGLAVDCLRAENGSTHLSQSFTLPLGADAVIADPEKTGQALAAQLAAAGIRERRCVVCIPPGWALSTSTDVPEVTGEDLRGYLELRAESEFPMALSDLRLAYSAYHLPDGKPRATLVAVASKKMAAMERMLEIAGCRAVSISLGLNGCLPQPELPAAMHFLANGNHVDVVIAAGGGIAALRSLAVPALTGEATFDAGTFCRDLRITLGGLPETVRGQVRQARFGGAAKSAEALCAQIRPQLQELGIESAPCAVVARADGASTEDATAVEAAEQHFRRQPVAFEFVIPETNRWQVWLERFDSRRRRWLVAAAAGLIVLPLVVFIVRSKIESGLETEWNGMRKQVGELEVLQQKIRQFRPWFEPAPQDLQILEGLAAAFPESGEVWAKSIQMGEGSKVTCTGFARAQPAFMSFLERLRVRTDVADLQVQSVRGENPVQFSITYKRVSNDAK